MGGRLVQPKCRTASMLLAGCLTTPETFSVMLIPKLRLCYTLEERFRSLFVPR